VTEAKNIEGSAVVKGSNFVTPTYSVEAKTEPPAGTKVEPVKSIQAETLLKMYNIKL
jgi:hypothetical protein